MKKDSLGTVSDSAAVMMDGFGFHVVRRQPTISRTISPISDWSRVIMDGLCKMDSLSRYKDLSVCSKEEAESLAAQWEREALRVMVRIILQFKALGFRKSSVKGQWGW